LWIKIPSGVRKLIYMKIPVVILDVLSLEKGIIKMGYAQRR
jgi:hypothetical protein